MSRSRNHSCSCWMCQPHKHGVRPKLKPSERRKVQSDGSPEFGPIDEVALNAWLSRAALARIWDTPEEDEAWKDL